MTDKDKRGTDDVTDIHPVIQGQGTLLDAPELTQADVDSLTNRAEKFVEVQKRLKCAALKSTNRLDWVLLDGKPYLQGTGAEKVALIFGVSIKDIRFST